MPWALALLPPLTAPVTVTDPVLELPMPAPALPAPPATSPVTVTVPVDEFEIPFPDDPVTVPVIENTLPVAWLRNPAAPAFAFAELPVAFPVTVTVALPPARQANPAVWLLPFAPKRLPVTATVEAALTVIPCAFADAPPVQLPTTATVPVPVNETPAADDAVDPVMSPVIVTVPVLCEQVRHVVVPARTAAVMLRAPAVTENPPPLAAAPSVSVRI